MDKEQIDALERDILELEPAFARFRRTLRKGDQELFDGLLDQARKRALAVQGTDQALPFEAILLAMVIGQGREIERLRERVAGRVRPR
jgi:hypothetical protein